MSITISPLDLLLDDENPRFVILNKKGQADIRKYLVSPEKYRFYQAALVPGNGLSPISD